MSSAYPSGWYAVSAPSSSPTMDRRSPSSRQNEPNASGVPGAASHGVVMHSMFALGSPVSSRMRAVHRQLDHAGQTPRASGSAA